MESYVRATVFRLVKIRHFLKIWFRVAIRTGLLLDAPPVNAIANGIARMLGSVARRQLTDALHGNRYGSADPEDDRKLRLQPHPRAEPLTI
jgi:hypothetical protein